MHGQTFCMCIAQLNFVRHHSFVVLALYDVLCWFYYLNNTYNCSGHCDYTCDTECSTVVLHTAAFHMPVSQCRTCCLVVLSMGLFAMVFYLPALPMYCSVLHRCTAASRMNVPQHPTQMHCMFIQSKKRLSHISSH